MPALPPGVTGDDLDTVFAKKHLAKRTARAVSGREQSAPRVGETHRATPTKVPTTKTPAKKTAPAKSDAFERKIAPVSGPPNPAQMGVGFDTKGQPLTFTPTPPPAPPADKNVNDVVAGGQSTPAQGTEKLPLDLGQAETQAEQPYVSQLLAMLGPNDLNATSGLAQYLQSLPPAMAATVKSGVGNEMSVLAGMAPAIQAQAQQAGDAGMLANMLAAAKYQAIYRQGQYGAPTGYGILPGTSTAGLLPGAQPTPLGQLYQEVVGGGQALMGNSGPFIAPSNPKSKKQAPPQIN